MKWGCCRKVVKSWWKDFLLTWSAVEFRGVGCCRWWKSWWKALVRVESFTPCEFISTLIFCFPFFACSLAWVVFLLGLRYSIIFHERAWNIEDGCASRPEMDDDDLDRSEHYGDAQSFRALRKRKSKTDSTAGSGESCSKRDKTLDLLRLF